MATRRPRRAEHPCQATPHRGGFHYKATAGLCPQSSLPAEGTERPAAVSRRSTKSAVEIDISPRTHSQDEFNKQTFRMEDHISSCRRVRMPSLLHEAQRKTELCGASERRQKLGMNSFQQSLFSSAGRATSDLSTKSVATNDNSLKLRN